MDALTQTFSAVLILVLEQNPPRIDNLSDVVMSQRKACSSRGPSRLGWSPIVEVVEPVFFGGQQLCLSPVTHLGSGGLAGRGSQEN